MRRKKSVPTWSLILVFRKTIIKKNRKTALFLLVKVKIIIIIVVLTFI